MAPSIEINANPIVGTGGPDRAELSSVDGKAFAAVYLRVPGKPNQVSPPESDHSQTERLGVGYDNVPIPHSGVAAKHLDHFRAKLAASAKSRGGYHGL